MIKQSRKRDHLQALLNRLAVQMIQGSLVTLNSPCGKPSCACAKNREKYHKRYYLSWTEAGRTHMLYIPTKQLKAFKQGIRAWKDLKRFQNN